MIGKIVRNTARTKKSARKFGMMGIESIIGDKRLMRVLEYAARFLAAWLLAGAVIFDDYAPFGLGFVAVSGGGIGGLLALAGTVLGSVMKGGAEWAIKYSAIALLIYTSSVVFRDSKLIKKAWFSPASAGVMTACTGIVYVIHNMWGAKTVVFYIMEVLLAAASAYFYRIALSEAANPEQEKRRLISIIASACTLFIALSDVVIFNSISIGRCAAAVCVMIAAYKGGAAVGGMTGLALGVALDAAGGMGPFFSSAMGSAGVVAGLFAGNTRLASVACYIIANAIIVIWGKGGNTGLSSLYETFIASVVFLVLPDNALLSWKENLSMKKSSYLGEEKAKAYVRKKALLAAEAFSSVYEMLSNYTSGEEKNNSNVASVFEEAAQLKCAACADRNRCYGSSYEETKNAQNDASVKMILRGELSMEDFPVYFRDKCRDIKGYTDAVNEEYKGYVRRRERRSRADEGYEIICSRFLDMSDVFSGFSEQLMPAGSTEKEIEERINLYLRGKSLDVECAVFRDGNGRIHIELDGDGVVQLKRMTDWMEKLATASGRQVCEIDSSDEKRHVSLLEAEPLTVRIGVASMKREGESVNGDKGAYFKTDSGRLYVILSDGMGSGSGAAEDSEEVIKLLEKFLRAGINAENSMRLVGAAMQIKNEKMLSSASIDLLSINLFNGETDIFKYGAAPTFIHKPAGVTVMRGESLSAGMRGKSENLPDHLKTRLEAGSSAIVVSDGVIGGKDVSWISHALAEEKEPGKEFARKILEDASKRFGGTDDMTVLTVNVEKR